MSELSPRARQLLDAAQDDEPRPEDRDRVRAAVFAAVGLPVSPDAGAGAKGVDSASGAGSPAAASAKVTGSQLAIGKAATGALGLKLVAALVAAVAVSAGVYLSFSRGDQAGELAPVEAPRSSLGSSGGSGGELAPNDDQPGDAPTPATERGSTSGDVDVQAPGGDALAVPEVRGSKPAPPSRAAPPSAAAAAAPQASPPEPAAGSAGGSESDPAPHHATSAAAAGTGAMNDGSEGAAGDLRREHALLRRARAALRRDRSDEAMKAVREHAREFPDGVLAQEGDLLEILILCTQARLAAAQERTRRFRQRYPRSPLRSRLESSCGAR